MTEISLENKQIVARSYYALSLSKTEKEERWKILYEIT